MRVIWYVRIPVAIFAFAGIISTFQYNPSGMKYLLMNAFYLGILWNMAQYIDAERETYPLNKK